MWDFIFNPEIGPYSRIKRYKPDATEQEGLQEQTKIKSSVGNGLHVGNGMVKNGVQVGNGTAKNGLHMGNGTFKNGVHNGLPNGVN